MKPRTTKPYETQTAPYRRVSQRELDQQIRSVARHLGCDEAQRVPGQPRRISAADLVRRMNPFLVYN